MNSPVPQPWSEIRDYLNEVEAKPLARLVSWIGNGPYADRLFAHTSVRDLIVTNYPNIIPGKDELRIRLDVERNVCVFEYSADPSHHLEFVRTYRTDELETGLQRFIEMIGW